MADTQILRPATVDAPFEYDIPANAEIVLKAVSGTVDGSGAAGAFQPLLIIESDAGEIVAESTAPEVAAGSVVRPSWFPFVDSGQAGAASAGAIQWAYISGEFTSTVCAPGTTSLTAVASTFYTNAPALFALAANGGVDGISLLAVGHYLITCTANPFGVPAAGSLYEIQNAGGDADADFFGGKPVARIPAAAISDEGVVNVQNVMTVRSGNAPTSAVITQIVNSGAGAVTMLYGGMMISQLDSDGTNLT